MSIVKSDTEEVEFESLLEYTTSDESAKVAHLPSSKYEKKLKVALKF